MKPQNKSSWFTRFAKATSRAAGRPYAFAAAGAVVVIWILTGPLFHFSDTWQLVINTGTTIVTFLMVFLIQNTQNRDSEAVQVKLDELIRALEGAHNEVMDTEDLEDRELDRIRDNYSTLAKQARADLRGGTSNIRIPERDKKEAAENDNQAAGADALKEKGTNGKTK